MDTTTLARFAHACGAIRPFEIAIERSNGTVIARGKVSLPCAVIGRESFCDIYVNDVEIAGRHVALQVIDGRIFAIDLSGKPNGLTFAGVARQEGWLTEGVPVGIGPHRLVVGSLSKSSPTLTPADYHPLVANSKVVSSFVKCSIEFRNGRTAQSRWDVNRVLTLVGRAKNCKINLTSEDVSLIHCYFLLTNDGLWVVDAFGRGGVLVDGIPVRFARLRQTDDVGIARFHLGCSYPNGDPGEPVIPLSPINTPVKWPEFKRKENVAPLPEEALSDELHTPMPSIPWADVFGENDSPNPKVEMPRELVVPAVGMAPADTSQKQMFEQFQQSMLMMMKMFGQMQQQQMSGIQQEMTRLANLTEELARLQSQIASAVGPAPAALPHYNPLPAPEDVPSVSEDTAQQHQFVFEKMAQMEAERQTIWKKLAGMMATKPPSA